MATVETDPVYNPSSADDISIWIHPENLFESLVIGTDKHNSNGGIIVYDLEGNEIQYLQIGRVNNIDLRYNFKINGEKI